MTAPAVTRVPAAAPAPGDRTQGRKRRLGRWVRLVVPIAVVGLFWVVGLVAHATQQIDRSDPGTLSPTGTGPHGSNRLAELLRAQGVTVLRVTSTDEAISTASRLDATIFVPATDYAGWWLMDSLTRLPGRHRLVLAQPGEYWGRTPAITHSRWATQTVEPRCNLPEAVAAGAAAVHRDVYANGNCYGGSLAEYPLGPLDVVAVGATDPFRNDRIDEAGNATLATGLLAAHGRVIWLDAHELPPDEPAQADDGTGISLPGYDRPDQDRERDGGDSVLAAFPAQLWVGLILLVGVGVLLALAQGRRLGPPVAEPLPVLVPAAESVLGRGRLYRRIRARGASLATLRTAAVARLARVLDPLARPATFAAPGPARQAFVAAVAARARMMPAAVEAVLFGPDPADDEALVHAVAELGHLIDVVTPPPPRQPGDSR